MDFHVHLILYPQALVLRRMIVDVLLTVGVCVKCLSSELTEWRAGLNRFLCECKAVLYRRKRREAP